MGLKKSFETGSGVSGDYWRITQLQGVRAVSGEYKTSALIQGFVSKAVADDGKSALSGMSYSFIFDGDKDVAECYAAIKADEDNDYFSDAEDV